MTSYYLPRRVFGCSFSDDLVVSNLLPDALITTFSSSTLQFHKYCIYYVENSQIMTNLNLPIVQAIDFARLKKIRYLRA